MNIEKIKELIPHREPFLFIDQIIDHTENSIISEITFDSRHRFLEGHFPENPIVPGVIMQEAVFQTSAVLMGLISKDSKTPIITRIENCKFKNMAKPGEKLIIEAKLDEVIGNAFFMKASVKSNGKTLVQIHYRCAHV